LVLTVLVRTNLTAQDGKPIEILSADVLEFDQKLGNVQRCKGNVRFKQGTVLMDCDSAWFYEDKNQVEAFGDIYIRQLDTFDLRGNYLKYNGDNRTAVVEKDVRLSDGEMVLNTQVLNYDVNNKIGYYTVGGDIRNGSDRLTSRVGRFYSRSKTFFFKDSVVLTNPEYVMVCDTLQYNTVTKKATFLGPTTITSEENTIRCNYGWYNTETNLSQFSNRVSITGKENQLTADSMWYNRNTGEGRAKGDIELIDSVEDIVIRGQKGYYNRKTKKTLVTDRALAIKKQEDGSFFLRADTLLDQHDSGNVKRWLTAYPNAVVFQKDMQARADSLEYRFSDSIIGLYENPFVWTDSSQISGDTIFIYRKNNELDRMFVDQNALVIERDKNGFYNQVKGRELTAYFRDRRLNKIRVNGNGESVYYAQEDTGKYVGVNDVKCGKMEIRMDTNNKVKNVVYFDQPDAVFYPLNELPKNREKLQGFNWLERPRPRRSEFDFEEKPVIKAPAEQIEELPTMEAPRQGRPFKKRGERVRID
jgi:lipopolysaccharide export system protein LptA